MRCARHFAGIPAAAAVAALCSPALFARDLPYGAVTDSAVQRCDAQQWRGALNEARVCYLALLQSNGSAARRAEAAWALGDLKSANDLFRMAVAGAPQDALLRVRWADLYVQTHQDQQALDLYEEALKLDAGNAYARVGAGSLLAGQFSAQANKYLNGVLEDEKAAPGARLQAVLLAASVALENSQLDKGAALIDQAAALASAGQLPQLEVYALRAALATLRDQSAEVWTAAALKDNPAWGGIYEVPAHFFEIRRRNSEALALYRKAVQLQPDLWSARVSLGSELLRENRLTEAREQYEAAYKGDPYDPRITNTLRLLDSLAKFELVSYPAQKPGSNAAPQLMLRMNRKESPVLGAYAQQLALQAMGEYAKRYRYNLKEPVVVEIYPDHEDFAVRTAGMPGLGLLGVTFGYVVAMDSPESRAVNEFHWGTTLWHELAHVYTLESTHHRVPRWFSEGLSVYEEWSSGPVKGVDIPGYVFVALRDGKALPVADLDRGFIRPEYSEQVQVSYMQAGLICRYIEKTWGFDKLVAMLAAYRDGAETPKALQDALGISTEEFDRRFDAWMKNEYRGVFGQYEGWRSARSNAAKAVMERDWNAALTQSQQALAILPQDIDNGSAYVSLAAAYAGLQRGAEARQTLLEYWQRGGHDADALRSLARGLHAVQDARALQVMQGINLVAPFDYSLHSEFAGWLLDASQPAQALSELQVAAALDAPDKAELHYNLARAQRALGNTTAARSEVLQALEVAPNYKPAQKLLLEFSRQP
ncbi:MAG: tetratricopeptide repeat protein [Steroidobacteraceae bacterium]